jgi:hypothetical protein
MPPYAQDYRFPPYGVLNQHFEDVISEHPLFPIDWTGFPEGTGSLPDQWEQWREATLDIIAKNLWPRFCQGQGWCGDSADSMVPLTETDLVLMKDIRKLFEKPASSHSPCTNRELFENEDTQAKPFGSMHANYDPTLPFRLLEKMPRVAMWSLGSKAGTAAPQIKRILQRPRGYQIAALWGRSDFVCDRAISSDSPSICSGHAYEGTMMVGGIIDRFLLDHEDLTPNNWFALQQYAVDIGDRRVMAGVHYPSDNLASWLMVMRIAPSVFRDQRVKGMLWDAITNNSQVYAAIRAAIADGAGEVYRPAVEALEHAAEMGSYGREAEGLFKARSV